jgi:lysophospholipase L1-like esterase
MNICIFGDSIAWGAYDPEYGGWVNRMRSYFESLDQFIYNLGIPGDSTTDLLFRVEAEAKLREADVIIFAIGVNDAQSVLLSDSSYIADTDFKFNLEKLYEKAKKFTDKIIFVGLTPVDELKLQQTSQGYDTTYTNQNIKRLDKIIHDFCQEKKIRFVPMNDKLSDDDFFDGIHPNTKGHNKIFGIMKPEIESAIK